jgi:hypothetical protein
LKNNALENAMLSELNKNKVRKSYLIRNWLKFINIGKNLVKKNTKSEITNSAMRMINITLILDINY